jgi:hypothetical protein
MNFNPFSSQNIKKEDRVNLIQSLHIMLENGESDISRFADIQISFYKGKKKHGMVSALYKLKKIIQSDGYGLSDALYKSTIINKNEKLILDKSSQIEKGLEYIIKDAKKDVRVTTGFILLLVPPLGILIGLLLTQPIVKETLVSMTEPIVSAGATPPPLPYYMTTQKVYAMWNIVIYGAVIAYFSMLYFFKKARKSKDFFKMMFLYEIQYSKEILAGIIDLVNNGSSIATAVETLLKIETNPIKKQIFKEIDRSLTNGKSNAISSIMRKHGMSEDIIMFVEQGEVGSGKNSNIFKYLNIAYKIVDDKYERYSKKWITWCMWGGQFSMLLIFLPTMTDILLYTSISQLNFQV